MKRIIFTFDPEEFKKDLLAAITKDQSNKSKHNKPFDSELLTREETYKYLRIAPSTLWKLTKSQKLKAYYIGNRVFYKKHEIDQVLISI